MRRIVASICAGLAGCATTSPRPMQLQRVILYQNGIGYFERAGRLGSDTLTLQLARGELDDVLKTLTVIDHRGASVATVDVPTAKSTETSIALGVRLSGARTHDLSVGYAVPTPMWKATYRVVLADHDTHGLLQAWAMVNNVSQEDWHDVSLTLATGAPMSLALDLHTPQYVKRPDATGRLVTPTLTGPVDFEKVGAAEADHDGDGIVDAVDRCPDDARDREGCPDRGRVVISDTNIEILDTIYFPRAGDDLAVASAPLLDALAATLRGNPDITKLEVGGHASDDEDDVWGLSSRRAAAVRTALVQRGIDSGRLDIVPYGATRPLDAGGSAAALAKNRRVDFVIAARRDIETAKTGYDVPHARAAVRAATTPDDVAGSVRYAVTEPVTIRHGASTLVSIVNHPIASEDALLFRPDGNAPGSDRHPFRTVRLVNDSGFTLQPGPVAIFARGTFVGDSLMDRLELGETAWVPYALEGGTTVSAKTDDSERPVRIVSIHRGVITVENSGVRTTRYAISAGREAPGQLYIHHARLAGYAARDLPPKTIDSGDAYLVPVPLRAGATSELVIEEREPRRRTIELLDAGSTQFGVYVEGSKLPAEVATRFAAALALRKELGTLEDDRAALRVHISDLAARAGELRQSLRALDRVRGADELRKKLVIDLAAAVTDSDVAARALGLRSEELAAARRHLQDALREISLDDQR